MLRTRTERIHAWIGKIYEVKKILYVFFQCVRNFRFYPGRRQRTTFNATNGVPQTELAIAPTIASIYFIDMRDTRSLKLGYADE